MSHTAAIKIPVGQVVLIGMGAVALTNPDKFFTFVQRTALLFTDPSKNNGSNERSLAPPPILIQTTGAGGTSPSGSGGGAMGLFVLKLVVASGACWGSYVVMTTVLPEQVQQMLPVTTGAFKGAVRSLGGALINLKDTLVEKMVRLSNKQDEFGDRQDETHNEVLDVKVNVGEMAENMRLVKRSLVLCHESLSESERRGAHIQRGVQLLTRGVSTILHEDDPLLHDLIDFSESNSTKQSLKIPAHLQQLRQSLEQTEEGGGMEIGGENGRFDSNDEQSNDPENEHPPAPTMDEAERCVSGIRELLDSMKGN